MKLEAIYMTNEVMKKTSKLCFVVTQALSVRSFFLSSLWFYACDSYAGVSGDYRPTTDICYVLAVCTTYLPTLRSLQMVRRI